MIKKISLAILIISFITSVHGQLSQERLFDIAEIKVERFQNILDLTTSQAAQLKKETVKLLKAHSSIAYSKDIASQFNKNLDVYYASLTTFKPQQLATLKLMDSLDRQSRKQSYENLMTAYGHSSEFAIAVATYNWNKCVPILVSYRKDLDVHISQKDKITINQMREMMIAKYDFINNIRDINPSEESENIISHIQDEILKTIQDSELPYLLNKYEEQLTTIRSEMNKYSNQIKTEVRSIYDDHMLDNHQNQIVDENAFVAMLGISKLMRDSFFLLLDGESRSISFKINALHIMANSLMITDQF